MRLYQKYFPCNYDELITYYPKFYRDVLEMRAILEAHGAVLDELEDNIELVFFNNFIDTADEQTVSDLEKFLDIKLNRSRSLEVRRRFVKSFFVGFGKVSASILEAIISSYTHDTVKSRFEPFDSAGNNMLHLEYRRGDVPTLYLEDITFLISKKMPAHIFWHAMLTYHTEAGIGANRQHYVIDYDLAGTKPDIATLGGYSAAASIVKSRRIHGMEDYPSTAENGVRSGQYPQEALLARNIRTSAASRPEAHSHTADYRPADVDGYAGLFPDNAMLGMVQKTPVATKPDAENFTLDHESSGVFPEAALSGRIVRSASATQPETESNVTHYGASGNSPDTAFAGHAILRGSAAETKVRNIRADYETAASDGGKLSGTVPENASAGVIVRSENATMPSVEHVGIDLPGAAENGVAGAYPEAAETAEAKTTNAGAGVKSESFSVEYRRCGTGFAES